MKKGDENMKKIVVVLVLLMMLISITSTTLADEEAGEDDQQDQVDETQDQEEVVEQETQEEIKVMNTSLGAEIRLLQLKKALLKNILKGEMAVEVLKGLEFNTSGLEEILGRMMDLLKDINETNASSNDSVQKFVEFKKEAINLTKEFRETVRSLLDEEQLNELRERIRQMVCEQVEGLDKYIRNRIRQFNRNQLYRLYGLIGEANNSFIEEYLNGNITLGMVKLQLCKMINQMNRERRYEIFSELKEENIKKKINAEAFIDQMHGKGKGKGK